MALLAALAACAPQTGAAPRPAFMAMNECDSADWFRIGLAEGARGLSEDWFQRHQKDCGLHGLLPDEQAYRQGYAQGAAG